MSLSPGARLGPYEITGLLGAGGMGEVYRARDTRLDRIVAVKVLPATLAGDAGFRERFEREARSLSALSHPNICSVHDIGREGTIDYLVMEYVEGRTLAAMLEHGPLPVRDALRIAIQIGDALIQAHRRGIVHRDLKPGNVMIGAARAGSGTGSATLLDFGLAKRTASPVVAGTRASSAADATQAATLTGAGAILGTFHYMAPEQVEGREADERTDIWAFGCLLYEMLTGRRPFDASTSAGVVAAVIGQPPAPLALPDPALSGAAHRQIAACLEKDPNERFQSMRDVRRALEWMQQTDDAPRRLEIAARSGIRLWLLAGLAAAMLATGAALYLTARQDTSASATVAAIFNVTLQSPKHVVGPPAIFGGAGSGRPHVSPDGKRIAFIAHSATEASIWVRDLSKLDAQPLRGTSGVRGLFWAPDGSSIGFFADGKLKTIELASGRIDMVCDAPVAFGGTWGTDGSILFSPEERSPIHRVTLNGGSPLPVTTVGEGEHAHRWPQWLADGRHFLYMTWSDSTMRRDVKVASADGRDVRTLFEAQSGGIPAGDHILFVLDAPARLMAWRFDSETLQVSGKPFPLVSDDNVDYHWVTGEPNASVGGATLAYTTGKYRRTQPTWVSRSGRPIETLGEVGVYFDPVISRDGTLLALEKNDLGRGSGDIWTVDLARGAFSRLTSAPGFESTAIWSPDGRLAYASDQGPAPAIYVINPTGVGGEKPLISPESRSFPLDWSSDGRYALFMLNGGATRTDLWIHDFDRGVTSSWLASPFNEGWAQISPDGRWIAYVSDESQQREVYVRSFPDGASKTQLSTAGGSQPQWRQDGRELYYIAPDNTIMAVAINVAGTRVQAVRPEALFIATVDQNRSIRNQYVASADGTRFLLLSVADRDASPIVGVLNWRGLIRE